jgi:hypothetical protein
MLAAPRLLRPVHHHARRFLSTTPTATNSTTPTGLHTAIQQKHEIVTIHNEPAIATAQSTPTTTSPTHTLTAVGESSVGAVPEWVYLNPLKTWYAFWPQVVGVSPLVAVASAGILVPAILNCMHCCLSMMIVLDPFHVFVSLSHPLMISFCTNRHIGTYVCMVL